MRGLVIATMVFRGVEYGLSGHDKVGVKKKKKLGTVGMDEEKGYEK